MYKGAYILLKTCHHLHLKLLQIFVISTGIAFLIPEKLEVLNIYSSHSIYQAPNAHNKIK